MAIETAEQLASTIGYGLPFRTVLPWIETVIGQGELQHISGVYSGIDIGGVTITYINVTGPMSVSYAGVFGGVDVSGIGVTGYGPQSTEKAL